LLLPPRRAPPPPDPPPPPPPPPPPGQGDYRQTALNFDHRHGYLKIFS
jgi:hypothetical protein